MKIETRFNLGDTIYVATTDTKESYIDCPECNGTGIWTAETANGPKDIRCGGCHGRPHDASLRKYKIVGAIHVMTVGQIRTTVTTKARRSGHASNILFADDPAKEDGTIEEEYMTFQTGIGSGSIWKDELVFATQEEALAKGEELAADIRNQIETRERERVEKVEADEAELRAIKAERQVGIDEAIKDQCLES